MNNNNNSTLLMVAILAVVAMLSAGVAAIASTMQQASAQDTEFSFEQDQSNRCSDFAGCVDSGEILSGILK